MRKKSSASSCCALIANHCAIAGDAPAASFMVVYLAAVGAPGQGEICGSALKHEGLSVNLVPFCSAAGFVKLPLLNSPLFPAFLRLVAQGLFTASRAVLASHCTRPTLAFDTNAPRLLLQRGPAARHVVSSTQPTCFFGLVSPCTRMPSGRTASLKSGTAKSPANAGLPAYSDKGGGA